MADSRTKDAYLEGHRALERRDFARAVAVFGRALVIDPEDPMNLHGAAVALTRLSRFGEAEPLFRRAVDAAEAMLGRNSSTVAIIALDLIDLYRNQGRYDEAEQLCRRILRGMEASSVETLRARVLVSLAELYRRQGRHGDAERAYRAGIDEQAAALGRHPGDGGMLSRPTDLSGESGRASDTGEQAGDTSPTDLANDRPAGNPRDGSTPAG